MEWICAVSVYRLRLSNDLYRHLMEMSEVYDVSLEVVAEYILRSNLPHQASRSACPSFGMQLRQLRDDLMAT